MQKELSHEPDARRYVLRLDGDIASVLDYRELGDSVELVREIALKAGVDLTLCLRGKAVCRGVHGTSLSACCAASRN